jgi:hypothetical protein
MINGEDVQLDEAIKKLKKKTMPCCRQYFRKYMLAHFAKD